MNQSFEFELESTKTAVISDCEKYRYHLTRTWDKTKRSLLFIMLNPSTADANYNDPTITRCIGFANKFNFGAISVVNLFAYRATDSSELERLIKLYGMDYIIGPENNYYITSEIHKHKDGIIICAWGAMAGRKLLKPRVIDVLKDYPLANHSCLGITANKMPKHPLYLPENTMIQYYPF